MIADRWKWRIVITQSILAVGCHETVPRERLVGTYCVDYGHGAEQLTLSAEGTYTQEFAANGQACRAINHGRVNLATGLFTLDETDLYLPDVMPIVLTRTYRQRDTDVRAFGIGATHPYSMFLWSAQQYQL